MKLLTKTRATYRGVLITVSSDQIEGKTMFSCRNSAMGPVQQDQWFLTQGEAIANERREIDKKMGISVQ